MAGINSEHINDTKKSFTYYLLGGLLGWERAAAFTARVQRKRRMRWFLKGSMSVLLAVGFLALFSCENPFRAKPPAPPAAFSARAEVSFGSKQFVAEIQQESPGIVTASFTEPKELQGLTIAQEGSALRVRYGQDEVEFPSLSALPKTGFLPLLREACLELMQPQSVYTHHKDDTWTVDCNLSGFNAKAKLNKDGYLKTLEVPVLELIVKMAY
ncbi:MAG: hypothetical protein LBR73_00830 [Oscillospiraceae bacterium]|jgi:hypothetical protein|nr:hypothetical protein [Oscillospiraceae bacterium]